MVDATAAWSVGGGLDAVIAAYLVAVRAGHKPDRDAWLARYPQWTTELTGFFADYDWGTALFAPLRPLLPSPSLEDRLP